ncbi:MAG: universal stress protein [Actinomycetota bacterium]|nr:universal stress protein [Actinomycetota bacterium]
MTLVDDRPRIVVAINDTSGARAALSWAATEAVIRRTGLILVHVPDRVAAEPYGGRDVSSRPVSDEAGSVLLRELALGTQLRHPRLAIETMLGRGDVIATLVELSGLADLVVLGTTGAGGNLASLLGSVSQRVAVHAHCPVAIVGPGVRPLFPADRESAVVVGLSPTPAGLAAIRFAFAEADRRGVRLTAVRAGEPRAAASDDAELDAGRERYPRVALDVIATLADPVTALLREAAGAGLLVLGAHHSEDRWSTRLGPVPQSLVRHTSCPVVLIGSMPYEDGTFGSDAATANAV